MNRGFLYGDGFFETICVRKGKILWWDKHFERIKQSCELLEFETETLEDEEYWKKYLEIQIPNDEQDYRLRVNFYRAGAGFYTPEKNKFETYIELSPLTITPYQWNDKGLSLGIYPDIQRLALPISTVKTTNALPSVLASIYKKKQGYDEVILLNNWARVAETAAHNIFVLIDDEWKTPALSEGCINGVMRKNMIEWLSAEETELEVEDLSEAEEIFLTNVVNGLHWVSSFEGIKYNKTASIEAFKILVEKSF